MATVVEIDNNELEGGTVKRAWRWPLAGFVVGGLVGATFLTVNIVGASAPDQPPIVRAFGEILHTPPFLVGHDQPVELTFGIVCGSRSDKPDPCSPKGSVFVRSTPTSDFAELPLVENRNGELVASVPEKYLGGGGFDYYASIENGRGQSASLPEGAADAPQHTWIVPKWTQITLGAARFADAWAPSAVVARARWGNGARELGLNSGREQSRIGPSAFDVAPDGSIVVLDQVNRRLVVYRNGEVSTHLPIEFFGGEGDLAVGRNGAIYVLDQGGTASSSPLVRSFDAGGTLLAGVRLAQRTADMVRAGPNGPLVHGYPSEMWSPTGGGRPPLGPERQISLARPGRAVAGGLQVVVRAVSNEARFALARPDSVVRSWLIKSSTPLGEVQLAEPYGDGLVVVLRRWTEARAEFRVLRLTPTGLSASFSVEPAEWAETASLSRFRLHGTTLYQLRSAPAGVEIVAFQIGGTK